MVFFAVTILCFYKHNNNVEMLSSDFEEDQHVSVYEPSEIDDIVEENSDSNDSTSTAPTTQADLPS